ncbi:MAG TPA: hypothetical protein VLB49_03985, partial [Gemmatimonadales bacterium]|nr:hypothetical protein [Gemmatimonadales bacterium]
MLNKEWTGRLGAAGLAALFVFGCSPDSTGSRLVTVKLSLARADAAQATASAPQLATTDVIDPGLVEKIEVTLEAVELQTPGSGWQRVTLDPALSPFDLKALPAAGSADEIELGEVQVVGGTCEVRLFVSGATITFNDDVVIGTELVTAGTEVDVTIPSGPQTGVKVDGICD